MVSAWAQTVSRNGHRGGNIQVTYRHIPITGSAQASMALQIMPAAHTLSHCTPHITAAAHGNRAQESTCGLLTSHSTRISSGSCCCVSPAGTTAGPRSIDCTHVNSLQTGPPQLHDTSWRCCCIAVPSRWTFHSKTQHQLHTTGRCCRTTVTGTAAQRQCSC